MSLPVSGGSRRSLAITIGLTAIVAAAGVTLFTVATSRGIGTDIDSASYFSAAQNLRGGHGLRISGPGGSFPFTRWPPLFPSTIATVSHLGWDVPASARVLNGALLIAMIALVAWTIHRVTHSWVPALFAAILVLRPASSFDFYTVALSEPLAMVLGTLGLVLIARHLVRPARWCLVVASIALALAVLTRFAAVAYVLAAALALVLPSERALRDRLRDAVTVASVGVVPTIAWVAFQQSPEGSNTGRSFAWHPIPAAQLRDGFLELLSWIAPSSWVHPLDHGFGVVLLVAIAFVVVVGFGVAIVRAAADHTARGRVVSTMLAFCIVHVAFSLVSISLLDAGVHIGGRTLAPLFPPLLIAGAVSGWAAWTNRSPEHRSVKVVGALAVGVFVLATIGTAVSFTREARRDGIGFAGREYSDSPVLAAVRQLPAHVAVFSNEPAAVSLVTHHPAAFVPREIDSATLAPDKTFDERVVAQRAALAAGQAVVVWLDRRVESEVGFASEDDMRNTLGLCAVDEFADGTIYRAC